MPKMVEIDEEQFLRDQKLRETVAKIMANGDAALKVEEALKMVDPTAKTPRLDQAKVVKEPVDAVRKEIDDLKAAMAKSDADRTAAEARAKLHEGVQTGLARLRQAGWTDDGIKGVEKIMEEKGILDPDVAAAYFEKQHPPQTPVKPGGAGAWNFMDMPAEGDDDLKKLVESKGQHDGLVQKMAIDALNEVRGSGRR
jgi:hypothetical protein